MITVADVMTRRPVGVAAGATVADALQAMTERGISSVLVLPLPGSTDYGILTMHDIVGKVVQEDLDPDAVRVGDIMTWRVITARAAWSLEQAAALMADAGVRRLPVIEGHEIIGLISDTDIFTALVPRQEWEHVRQVRKERSHRRVSQTGPAKTVADLMSVPVLTISPQATVETAVAKMVAAGISSLLVIPDGEGRQGIVTKRDIVTKVAANGQDAKTVVVREIMSSPVRTITPEVTLEVCSVRMASERVRRLPVARESRIIGIISDSDILAAVAGHRWWGHRRRPTSAIAADIMRSATTDLRPGGAEAISPELSLWECAARLAHTGASELRVVQEGRVIGVVAHTDIVRALEERGGGD
jgi:CBS domain-containing protein